jgi:very-short-patch-repair endonuclease
VKKTLSIRPESERPEAPALEKKGRGWAISESRLDALHETAREMKRSPTPAHTLLSNGLVAANLGKFSFRRQVVIGSAIVDFACQPLKVVVLIDEEDGNPEIDRRRDKSLAEVGLKVLHYPAADVLADTDAVVAAIVAELKTRWEEQRANRRPSSPRSSSPRSSSPRPNSARAYSPRRGHQE